MLRAHLQRLPKMHLIFDFDGTITTADTIGPLAAAAIAAQKRRGGGIDLQPAWDALLRAYLADYDAYRAGFRPPEAARTTVADRGAATGLRARGGRREGQGLAGERGLGELVGGVYPRGGGERAAGGGGRGGGERHERRGRRDLRTGGARGRAARVCAGQGARDAGGAGGEEEESGGGDVLWRLDDGLAVPAGGASRGGADGRGRRRLIAGDPAEAGIRRAACWGGGFRGRGEEVGMGEEL
ncbi:Haloacid dehalogenase-like hydrolase [Cordyceps fumosorosea ARSEF 2679]|uniref:Haloacid dehalogenase-like hydrolase n=1 Tax=Cordyceps fumosorosea (strain ARSEF 2679) TaxID=1081104 RepID=A0A167XGK0_CORFA|nr:Haloacid dehalogenase-like hydrolase [Cordyceps fumosorosea ARSEF 2679]OAA64957.1 Haloacid dehalogenase-like hydrolase [Cordyceps fumosorosea ARSEF 2679]